MARRYTVNGDEMYDDIVNYDIDGEEAVKIDKLLKGRPDMLLCPKKYHVWLVSLVE